MKKENENPSRRWSIEKRLEFIDFQLFWRGVINRSDIIKRFKVSMPQASSDLSIYKSVAANNLEYDLRERKYFATKKFKPAFFLPDSDKYLWMLRDDISALSASAEIETSQLPSHDIVNLPKRRISAPTLRSVVHAIHEKKAIQIFYQSMSSEEPSWRFISPHSLAFDGLRWHARAFCHTGLHYKDFLLSRIQEISGKTEEYNSGADDEIWNTYCEVVLRPHPKLSKSQAEAVAKDYGMKDLRLSTSVRLALLYYFLRRLELNNRDDEKKNPREQHVVIDNKAVVDAALRKINDVNKLPS